MDLRLTFNSDPSNYEKFRSTYIDVLFDDLIKYSTIDNKMKAIEIGIGTGQATTPILETGCHVTAIEIGEELANFTREKFSNYNNINVINNDFEKVNLESNSYDLVYSASAFHWIPLDIGMTKVLRLLKAGGTFAWISTTPLPSMEDKHINDKIQDVYSNYKEYFGDNKDKRDLQKMSDDVERKLASRVETFKTYSFTDVYSAIYKGSRTFNAENYAKVISTYSDHKAMPIEIRTKFLNEIKDTINNCGGEFTLTDRYLICMGRKWL